ncbi:MAG: family 20 glycosylhydrolase [Bacteroidales bacterium]|nr:family 20 glycosylhydrolase [Bacteroidales bacterium]MCF8458769.1 family 20 glycosylhydrolase [Bacteroidales bacterium]
MRHYFKALLIICLAVITLSCSEKPVKTESNISIIPKPASIQIQPGEFEISTAMKILYQGSDDIVDIPAFLNQKFQTAAGFQLKVEAVENNEIPENSIVLELGSCPDSLGMEGYLLKVDKTGIRINAIAASGLFYGLQTLRQMLPAEIESPALVENVNWTVPFVEITDKPRFGWRGMLLDCCRHFMEKDFVLRYIDLLAYHKMNRLHWHLTEDQGWRIEIKQFPTLTEIGAWRTEEDGSRYGGFYTQDEIREVVAYAKSRFIEVVPEIELPGHSLAALAAFPELSCTGGPFEVGNQWGVFKDIYCAGNDKSFEFLEKVYDEIFDLFPFEYVHIGGDEAPKYRWENCDKCQKRIKDEGLKNEHELQSYFITRMEKYINANGRKLIGWDEILEGGLAPSATVQSWRGFEGAKEAAEQGHDAIVSPTSHAYFDYSIETTDLKQVYSFEPVPTGLDKEHQKHIIGGECNMWTERAPQEEIDDRMFPRLLAMSEVLWTDKGQRDYSDFHARVQDHYNRLDFLGVKYGFESMAVSVISEYDPASRSYTVQLISGQKGFDLFYTLDGSEPTIHSTKYEAPINIDKSTELNAIAAKGEDGPIKTINQKFTIHKAMGKKVELEFPFSPNYDGSSPNALVDGLCGTENFRDGKWQGFQGNDLVAVIDLGEPAEFSKVTLSCLQSMPSWILMPTEITVLSSADGVEFTELASLAPNVDQKRSDKFIMEFPIEFLKTSSRFIKVIAKNVGTNPDWHDAAGSASWLFADEIVVE